MTELAKFERDLKRFLYSNYAKKYPPEELEKIYKEMLSVYINYLKNHKEK